MIDMFDSEEEKEIYLTALEDLKNHKGLTSAQKAILTVWEVKARAEVNRLRTKGQYTPLSSSEFSDLAALEATLSVITHGNYEIPKIPNKGMK
jgi:hypothetical protein